MNASTPAREAARRGFHSDLRLWFVLLGCLTLGACRGDPDTSRDRVFDAAGSAPRTGQGNPGDISLPDSSPQFRRGAAPVGGKRIALVIAADEYRIASPAVAVAERRDWNIPFARRSAERFRDTLTRFGGFAAEEIRFLRSSEVTAAAIESAIDKEIRPRLSGPGNVLLVYYAGHGMADGPSRRASLFVHDTMPQSGGKFGPVLDYDEIQAWMRVAQEDVRRRGGDLSTAFIVDACQVEIGAPPTGLIMPATADVVVHSTKFGEFAQATQTGFTYSSELCAAIETLAGRGSFGFGEAARIASDRTLQATGQIQAPAVEEKRANAVTIGATPVTIGVRVVDGPLFAKGADRTIDAAQVLWNGREVTTSLLPTTYTLHASAPGYLPWEGERAIKASDSGSEIVIPLYPEFVIVRAALVTADGDPARALEVSVGGGQPIADFHRTKGVSDERGAVELRIPPADDGRVLLVRRGDAEVKRLPLPGATSGVRREGLVVPLVDAGRIVVARAGSALRGAAFEIAVETIPDEDLELGVPLRVEFPPEIDLPDGPDTAFSEAEQFATAGRLDRAEDKLREILDANDARIAAPTRARIEALANAIRFARAVEISKRDPESVRTFITSTRDIVAPAYREALDRLRANLSLGEFRAHRSRDVDAAIATLETELTATKSDAVKRHLRERIVVTWLEEAERARSASDLERSLIAVRAAKKHRDTRGEERAILREIARRSLDAREYLRADQALSDAIEIATDDDGLRGDLLAERISVRVRWIEAGYRHCRTSGGFPALRRLIEESLGAVGKSPDLVALHDEIEREAIEPATRALYDRARDLARSGSVDALEESARLYDEALGGANAHYRTLIRTAIDEIGKRIFRIASNAATEAEIRGADVELIFRERLRAARYRPEFASRDVLRIWDGSEDIRSRFTIERPLIEGLRAWAELLRKDTEYATNPAAREQLWEAYLAGKPAEALAKRARERLDAARAERGTTEAPPRTRREPRASRAQEVRAASGAAAPRQIPGFTFTAKNPQGYAEYRHDKTGIIFVLIPGGSFEMGADEAEHRAILASMADATLESPWKGWLRDELPRHTVTVDDFLFAKYEVTQAEWRRIMGTSPSYFKNAGDDAPVENVSWNLLRGEDGANGPESFCGKTGLRLPTEAEWEYACRAGSTTAIYTGSLTIRGANHGPELDAIAWYGGNSGVTYEGGNDSSEWSEKQYPHKSAGTHPVGKKAPNAFGLHDMIGNVWEWCEDIYDAEFYGKPEAKVRNPVSRGGSVDRVIRGGSWLDLSVGCRSADRGRDAPGIAVNFFGVRPAFSPDPL
jgi:sulfatase modifying factor 1